MSDEQKEKSPDVASSSQDRMSDRLASLRASIRASKQPEPEPAVDAVVENVAEELIDAAPEPEPEAAPLEDPEVPALHEESAGEFTSDETAILTSSELLAADARAAVEPEPEPQDDEEQPPRRPDHRTGEQYITSDLHRVEPTGEHEALTSGGLVSEMDQASEAAADEIVAVLDPAGDATYRVGPTAVRQLPDLAAVQGTPLYMSPEQCRNDAVQPPTDVYSLGVMMFELLEGVPPFMADSIEEVIFKHLDAPVPQQVSEFTPDVVKSLVSRMLAKDPADRPEMIEIIEVLQQHTSIGGADVLGLEEESWSVSQIEESSPIPDAVGPIPAAAVPEVDAPPQKKPPIWIFALLGLVVLVVIMFAVVSGSDAPDGPPVEPAPVAEVLPEVPVEPVEPVELAEPAEGEEVEEPAMEFGIAAGDADAGNDAGATEVAVEEVEEPPPVEEVAEAEVKPKPKSRTTRKKKKKKPTLQEIRL